MSSSGSSLTSDFRRKTKSRNCCFNKLGYPPIGSGEGSILLSNFTVGRLGLLKFAKKINNFKYNFYMLLPFHLKNPSFLVAIMNF